MQNRAQRGGPKPPACGGPHRSTRALRRLRPENRFARCRLRDNSIPRGIGSPQPPLGGGLQLAAGSMPPPLGCGLKLHRAQRGEPQLRPAKAHSSRPFASCAPNSNPTGRNLRPNQIVRTCGPFTAPLRLNGKAASASCPAPLAPKNRGAARPCSSSARNKTV